MHIVKIGGSKITNQNELTHLIKIIENSEKNHFFIISAFGKTTSNLNKAISYSISKNLKYKQLLNHIYNFHLNLIDTKIFSIDSNNEIIIHKFKKLLSDKFIVLEKIFHSIYTLENISDKIKDKILTFGEILSFEILKFIVNELNISKIKFISAFDFITTDDIFGNATINYELTEKKLLSIIGVDSNINNNNVFLSQGFVGKSVNNNFTTLGLESSNYTAVLIAKILNSNSITFISDTFGIYDSDPRYFKNYKNIKHIGYDEAVILSNLGFKPINKKMIDFAILNNIAILFKSLYDVENTNITTIDNSNLPINSSIFIINFKNKKYNSTNLIYNNAIAKVVNINEVLINDTLYSNNNYDNINSIPILKVSVYNFTLNNLEAFRLKYIEFIDNIIIENKINTLHIFIDLNKVKNKYNNESLYKNFENILFEDLKYYVSI